MTKDSIKKIPRLRFKGFEGEWEDKKVKNISNDYIGGGTPSTKIKGYWENGNIPWIQSSNLKDGSLNANFEKYINKKAIKESGTKIIPKNSIAVVTRVGVGKLASINKPYATSQDFLSFSDLNVDSQFGAYIIYLLMNRLKRVLQGTSIKGITKNELLNNKLLYPNNLNEQQKIGSFFAKLDQLINLQTQKLEQLKKLKRGYLQKMFPQKGKSIPQLRFKGFEGEWEKSILGNLFNVKTGKSNYDKNLKSNNIYPILGSTSIIGYDSEYDYNGNFLLIARVGNAGYIYNYFGKVKITDNTIYIEYIYPKFLSYILKNENIKRLAFGSGRRLIKSSDIKKLYLKLPNKSEQKYLENLILKFENIIDLSREELTNFYKLKKSYLQKMFL